MKDIAARILGVLVLWVTGLGSADAAGDPQLWATGFAPAAGLAFTADGTAFVCNYRRVGTIGRILPDGTASIWCDLNERVPGATDAEPTSLAVDNEGRLLVGDRANGRLLRIDDQQHVNVLASRYDGRAFEEVLAVAHVAVGQQGPASMIAFAATLRRTGEEPLAFLFLLDLKTSTVRKIDRPLASPISLTGTLDGRWLIVVESPGHQVWRIAMEDEEPGAFQRVTELGGGNEGGDGNPLARLPLGLCATNQQGSVFVAAGHRQEIIELHVETGQTLRTFPLPGHYAVACVLHDQRLYFVLREKEAIFRQEL